MVIQVNNALLKELFIFLLVKLLFLSIKIFNYDFFILESRYSLS